MRNKADRRVPARASELAESLCEHFVGLTDDEWHQLWGLVLIAAQLEALNEHLSGLRKSAAETSGSLASLARQLDNVTFMPYWGGDQRP